MYYIVEFQTDLSCEIAPVNWLTADNKCLWPPVSETDDLEYLIRRMVNPGENWREYEIRMLGKAETYGEAFKKCKKAENGDSDLTSDPESYGRGKPRGIKRRSSITYDETKKRDSRKSIESDEDQNMYEDSASRIIQNLPIPPSPRLNDSESAPTFNDESFSQPSTSINLSKPARLKKNSQSARGSSQPDRLRNIFPERLRYSSQSENNQDEPTTPVAPKKDGLAKYICRELNVLRTNQERILDILGILMERNSNAPVQHTPIQPKLVQVFPITSILDIDQLEAAVADSTSENELLIKWKSFGGNNYGDHARRILRHLMTNDLAESFTWFGNGEKRRFCSLKLSQIIIDAVIQSHSVTRAKVEECIKTWLRHAKERKDYKKKSDTTNNK